MRTGLRKLFLLRLSSAAIIDVHASPDRPLIEPECSRSFPISKRINNFDRSLISCTPSFSVREIDILIYKIESDRLIASTDTVIVHVGLGVCGEIEKVFALKGQHENLRFYRVVEMRNTPGTKS